MNTTDPDRPGTADDPSRKAPTGAAPGPESGTTPDAGPSTPRLIVHSSLVYRMIIWLLVKPIYHLVYRVRVEGRELLPEGGALLAANHESFLDIPLVAHAAGKRHVAFVARDTLAKSRLLGFIMRQCGAVLVKRGSSDRRALREMVEHLHLGDFVGVFPEGTRTRDGALGPFKGGVLLAAKTARVPVLPVGIVGSFEAWPRDRKLPGFGRLVVRIGAPIDPRQPGALDQLRGAVETLSQP